MVNSVPVAIGANGNLGRELADEAHAEPGSRAVGAWSHFVVGVADTDAHAAVTPMGFELDVAWRAIVVRVDDGACDGLADAKLDRSEEAVVGAEATGHFPRCTSSFRNRYGNRGEPPLRPPCRLPAVSGPCRRASRW